MPRKTKAEMNEIKEFNSAQSQETENEFVESSEDVLLKSDFDFDKVISILPLTAKRILAINRTINPGEKIESAWMICSKSKNNKYYSVTINKTVLSHIASRKKLLEKLLKEGISNNQLLEEYLGPEIKKSEKVSEPIEENNQTYQKEEISILKEKLNSLINENIELKEVLMNSLTQVQSSTRIQYIPVEIYLDTKSSEVIFDVYNSVLNLLDKIGFSKSLELPAINKSWYKKMVAKSKTAITSDEVISRLKEVEYGVEVNTILKQQSEIDKNQSEALVNILKSLEKVNNGVIRIGSLLVVKLTEISSGNVNVQVRTLSISEMYILNKDPGLLSKPQQILDALSKAIDSSETSIN